MCTCIKREEKRWLRQSQVILTDFSLWTATEIQFKKLKNPSFIHTQKAIQKSVNPSLILQPQSAKIIPKSLILQNKDLKQKRAFFLKIVIHFRFSIDYSPHRLPSGKIGARPGCRAPLAGCGRKNHPRRVARCGIFPPLRRRRAPVFLPEATDPFGNKPS